MPDKEAEVSDAHYTLYYMVRSIHQLRAYLNAKPKSAVQKAKFSEKVADSLQDLFKGHEYLKERLPALHDEFACALPTIATMGRFQDTSYHELTFWIVTEIVMMFHGLVVGLEIIQFDDLFKTRQTLLSFVLKHFAKARKVLIAADDFGFDFDYLHIRLIKEYDFALERLRRTGRLKPLSGKRKASQAEAHARVKSAIRTVLEKLGQNATSIEIRNELGSVGSEARFWDVLREMERDGEWVGRQRFRQN